MRLRSWPIVLLLLAAALPGCFFNEIDKSMDKYDPKWRESQQKTPAPGGGAAAPAEAPAAPGAPAAPSGPSWWATAKTLGSEPKNESIAGCQLAGRLEYMLRDDCLARGGQPQ